MFTQILAIFVAITVLPPALAQVPAVAPTCYSVSGNKDAAACSQFVDNFCDTMTTITFRGQDTGSRCYMANGHRCDFIIFNTTPDRDPVINKNCKAVLKNTISKCPAGGRGKMQASLPNMFTVDPNDGTCFDVQGGL